MWTENRGRFGSATLPDRLLRQVRENLHGPPGGVWWCTSASSRPQADGTMKDIVVDFGVFKRAVRNLAEEKS